MNWEPKVGEIYTRMLAGKIASSVKIVKVDKDLVYACPPDRTWPPEECWMFDHQGKEVDPLMTQLMAKYGYYAVVSFIQVPGVSYDVKELEPKEL